MARIPALFLLLAGLATAQTPDPAWTALDHAYTALNAKDYDSAIAAFQQAIAIAPARPAIRKDLAYTLLKIGENEAARDQFGEAMRLDPADDHVALEYAFLCYETKQQAEARRIFDRIRQTGNATAEQAFQNIDRPLPKASRAGRRRWNLEPDNFSAHRRTGHAWPNSATNGAGRRALRKSLAHQARTERELLLDLGRVWQKLGRDRRRLMPPCWPPPAAREPRVREKRQRAAARALSLRLRVSKGRSSWTRPTSSCAANWPICIWKSATGPKPKSEFEMLHQQAPDDLPLRRATRIVETWPWRRGRRAAAARIGAAKVTMTNWPTASAPR